MKIKVQFDEKGNVFVFWPLQVFVRVTDSFFHEIERVYRFTSDSELQVDYDLTIADQWVPFLLALNCLQEANELSELELDAEELKVKEEHAKKYTDFCAECGFPIIREGAEPWLVETFRHLETHFHNAPEPEA